MVAVGEDVKDIKKATRMMEPPTPSEMYYETGIIRGSTAVKQRRDSKQSSTGMWQLKLNYLQSVGDKLRSSIHMKTLAASVLTLVLTVSVFYGTTVSYLAVQPWAFYEYTGNNYTSFYGVSSMISPVSYNSQAYSLGHVWFDFCVIFGDIILEMLVFLLAVSCVMKSSYWPCKSL